MKAIFKITAAATAVAAALALQLPAVAQTAGTVDLGGQIGAETCRIKISDSGNANQVTGGTKSISLGTVTSDSGINKELTPSSPTAGVALINLTDAAGSGTCVFVGGTSWNLMLDLTSAQILNMPSGTTALKNSLSSGATDAAVVLYGGMLADVSQVRLSLKPGNLVTGTRVSAINTTGSGPLVIRAKFVATTTSAATPGQYSASVPLVILYN